MEWKETTLRTVTISKESQKKISDERFAHIRKFKLNNTSIQETEIFIDKMTRGRSQNRSQAYVNVSEIDNSYQQDMDYNNVASNRNSKMIENYESAKDSEDGENEESGDFLSNSQRNDEVLPKVSEESDALSRDEKNESISKKDEMDCISENKEIEDNDCESQITDASGKLDENLAFSVTELNNSETNFKKSREKNKNTRIYSTCSNKNFRSPVKPLNNYKSSLKAHDPEKRKANNHDVDDTVNEISVEAKVDYLNSNDANNTFSRHNLRNEDVKTQYKYNVAEARFLEPTCSSTDRKYSDNLIEGSKERINDFHNDNIQMANREDSENRIKECQSYFTLSGNEVKGKETDRETGSKSVIDLIAYFESLNPPKQSKTKLLNIKSKTKPPTSKQDIKIHQIMKLNQSNQCNANQSLSAQEYTMISSKIDVDSSVVKKSKVTLSDVDAAMKTTFGSVSGDFLSHTISHNGKGADEIPSGNDLPNLNTRVKVRHTEITPEEFLSDGKANDIKLDTETTSELIISEENIDVTKEPTEMVSKAVLPCLNARKSRHRLSLTAKPGMCAFCKGKCVHIERSLDRSKTNEIKIKEHVFVFSDEVYKKTEDSEISNPTCCRSCSILNNVKPMYQLLFPKLDGEEEDSKIRLISGINKTKENGKFSSNNLKQTKENLSSTETKVIRLPFTQNSTKLQKHEKNHLPEKKKLKASERRPYMKSFIGVLLTGTIMFIAYYKGITEIFNLW